jgi:hypothetical protein
VDCSQILIFIEIPKTGIIFVFYSKCSLFFEIGHVHKFISDYSEKQLAGTREQFSNKGIIESYFFSIVNFTEGLSNFDDLHISHKASE